LVHSRFLLEHLGDPLAAVKEMARAVRPGGKVALFDDDHDIMRFWPEIPRFESVWKRYQRSYDRLGNDPLLGRRQPALLAAAGLVPTGCDWVFFGACHGSERFEPLVKNLAEVVRGSIPSMAKFGLVEPSTVETGLAELAAWSARPGASLWYAIAFAEAEKPAGL
jgi:SAM-dependent methyltransferase